MSEPRAGTRRFHSAALAVVGLTLGVGVALAFNNGGSAPATRANQGPSVTRFSFSDGALPLPPAVAADSQAPALALAEEPATAESALTFYLQSIVEGRTEAAYAVLDASSRRRFPSVASWTRARADLALPTGFEIGPSRAAFGGADRIEIEVVSTHRPSLDPTRGLVPARSRGLWTVERQDGRWRVGAEPVTAVPVLPDEAGASVTVKDWVDRLRACDPQGATSLQVGGYLYGPADFVRAPCAEKGAWTVGDPAGLDTGGDPRDLVAAFGPSVGSWARLVPVDGPNSRFYAVVAPMGDAWQVAGVADRG